jgi:hypothetical protein
MILQFDQFHQKDIVFPDLQVLRKWDPVFNFDNFLQDRCPAVENQGSNAIGCVINPKIA